MSSPGIDGGYFKSPMSFAPREGPLHFSFNNPTPYFTTKQQLQPSLSLSRFHVAFALHNEGSLDTSSQLLFSSHITTIPSCVIPLGLLLLHCNGEASRAFPKPQRSWLGSPHSDGMGFLIQLTKQGDEHLTRV